MTHQTGIIADPSYAMHLTGFGHPEQPLRFFAIFNALKKEGLLHSPIQPRSATDQEILLCHSSEYLKKVKQEVSQIPHFQDDGSIWLSTGDTPICSKSLTIARLAVGGVLVAIDLLMNNQIKNAFCIVRPPGHHASSEVGRGFCIFNNVAIGARYAQKKYGIKKVLIADWDVHHGDGTQAIFEADPSIFYFSTHRYGHGFYPGTGAAEERGKEGTILNYPIIPSAGVSPRLEVLKAFQTVLPHAMEKFQPDLVLISAGFDAHEKDPLGGFNLKEDDFAELTSLVKNIADEYAHGRLVSVLEGGYHLDALASSACTHVKALSHSNK